MGSKEGEVVIREKGRNEEVEYKDTKKKEKKELKFFSSGSHEGKNNRWEPEVREPKRMNFLNRRKSLSSCYCHLECPFLPSSQKVGRESKLTVSVFPGEEGSGFYEKERVLCPSSTTLVVLPSFFPRFYYDYYYCDQLFDLYCIFESSREKKQVKFRGE